METIEHWIAGARTPGTSQSPAGDVFNPSTGELTARVAMGGAAEVDEAVRAAAVAQREWQATPLSKRTKVLFRFRDIYETHADELATVITAQHGKTLDDARGEVARGLDVIEFACGVPHLLKGEFSENVSTDVDTYAIRQPLGVVAGITPFNFPAMVPAWMYPVAIAVGNAFILKPSEKDPSASLVTAEMWARAGLPDGVFNVVQGGKEAVDAILDHPGIAAVSFVGSTPIARQVYDRGTTAGKRVQALGGAKNHAIVLPDADVDAAAAAIIGAAYGSAGERCMALSVVVAVGDVADPLIDTIRQGASSLVVAAGDDPGAQMGPLVTGAHRDRVAGYIDAGNDEGATVVLDGRDVAVEGRENGFFMGPCLLDNVTPSMTVYRDEIFGPVLSIVRVDNFDEAINLVNANQYGNGVAIFTNDGLAARRFQNEIEVGMVGINIPIPVPMAYYSFGGWKQSLFGDSHVHGMDGVRFYTRTKAVTARWLPATGERAIHLGFPHGG